MQTNNLLGLAIAAGLFQWPIATGMVLMLADTKWEKAGIKVVISMQIGVMLLLAISIGWSVYGAC